MAKYRVWARLEGTFDDIEADSEEEAFQIASDALIDGGSWDYKVERIEDENDKIENHLLNLIYEEAKSLNFNLKQVISDLESKQAEIRRTAKMYWDAISFDVMSSLFVEFSFMSNEEIDHYSRYVKEEINNGKNLKAKLEHFLEEKGE